MASTRHKRRVVRHATQELQEADRILEGGRRVDAGPHYRSVIDTMKEMSRSDWDDADCIRVMRAYYGLLKCLPKSESPAPAVKQFLSEQPDIASLDYFIVKLNLVAHMFVADLPDDEGLDKYAGDPEYAQNIVGELTQVLGAMHQAIPGDDINAQLTDEQRQNFPDCYLAIANVYIQTANYEAGIEYLRTFLKLKLNSKNIDGDTFDDMMEVFEILRDGLPKYDVELRQVCKFGMRVFTDEGGWDKSATFKDFVELSSFLLRRINAGVSLPLKVFNLVLDVIDSRMQAGAFELMSEQYFPENEFRSAMLEPKNQQYYRQVREKFEGTDALFARMARDPSIIFSQELEIQRLRQRVADLERRLPQPAQPSVGGMFKAGKVRERDSEKDLNPDVGKRIKFSRNEN